MRKREACHRGIFMHMVRGGSSVWFIILLVICGVLMSSLVFRTPGGLVPIRYAYGSEKSEYLLFGPYITLSGGKYEVSFSLKIRGKRLNRPVASIEVVTQGGKKLFASSIIKGRDFSSSGAYQDFALQFVTSGARGFEFRLKPAIGATLSVDEVTIRQIEKWSLEETTGGDLIKGSTKTESINQAENFLKSSDFAEIRVDNEMFGHGQGYMASDPDASGGQALMVKETFGLGPGGATVRIPIARSELLVLLLAFFLVGVFLVSKGVSASRRGG